ncbi:FRAS1-related extracellular matrix protein 2-like, partial [Ixodes scapularis]
MTRRRRLLLWLLFAVLSRTGGVWGLAEKDIVVKNVPLRVPVGRYVFVSPSEDLRIRVAPGDSCSVQVVQSDEDGPVGSVRPGRLQPSNFPCGFGLGSVSYTHFGSRIAPLLDRVRLLVKYDAENETLIVPLVLVVTVLPTPFEIAVKVASLTVSRIGGESQSIGTDTLNFEVGDGVCRVRVQTEIHQLPRYGELVGDVPTQLTSCEAFLGGDIRYRHGGNHRSPNRDYIPMLVEVSDSRGHVVKKEWFQLPVRIQDGVENSAPQPTFASDLRLDVNQFIMTAITPAVLAAEDLESDSRLLLFNMRTFLGPEEGHFVSTDDRRLPATSFYQKDVQALKIAYVPPTQGSEERRVFRIELEVVDPEGAASDPFSLMIIVKPTNTISPLVIKNTGLTLFEGKSKKIVHSLLISDEDNRDDVSLTVVDGLRHGSLLVDGSETDSFAIGDLDQGLVFYRHDGSSTITDNIVFKMSDGTHEVEFLFPVTIYPDDDEPPLLNVNTGLSTQKGEDSQVTSRHLSATDVDSDDTTILYELLPPFPEHGTLILKQPEKPPESFRWEYREGVFEREVTKWTQTDLQEGRLFYRHTGDHVTEVTSDSVYFRLSDENNPPNESGINEFTIKIMPVDDIAPERSPEATLHLLVEEFQLTEITKLELRYRDLDTKEKDLRYRITKAPHDTDEANAMSPGMVVRVDNPDVEITEFTQAEVNHHKIAYKPPPIELGIVPRIIQFHFEVSDAGSNVLPDQVFTILLQPVDNKPPTVLNRGLSVVEKGFVDIRTEDLDATDTDTPSDELSFVIVKTPVYGRVRVGSDALNEDDFFKREDIVNGRVRYENIGGSTRKTDRIDIEVCDGVHRVPITVRVHIKPLSEEPQGLQKRPGTLNVYLSVNEGGKVLLGGHAFKVQNVNLEKGAVEFVLTHAPKQGSVQNNGLKTSRFTREDVLKRRVFYVHSGSETGERGSSDMFQLSLVEKSGSVKTDDVLVQVKIEPVDSVAPRVAVGPPLQVREGAKAAITRNYLSATDVDTNDEDILCSIDVQPSHGYVENVSPAPGSERVRAGVPVSAFTIGEVLSGWINYVQSIHRGFEPLEDNFTFICSDGVNVSPKSKFNVQIYPTNDEMPEIAADEMFVVEGGDVSLDTLVAQVTDMDRPPDQLAFRITKHPMHGRIVTAHSVVVDSFTKADVTPPSFIVYRHDDSETTSDFFELYVSDGMHQSSGRISVTIEPVDDETPRLVANTGLDVGVGEAKTITNRVLKAEDVDSEQSALVYSIIQPPKHGYLQYLNASSYRPQRNLSLGSNFTQQDIDRGLLVYRHTGVPGVRDLIKFDVTDGSNPLIDQFFWVTVESVDAVYPEVVNRGVRLPEGGKVILTTATLSTTDLNSDDELLRFTVTKSPSKGHLESTDAPGVILRTFTQMQLAGNKICYVHTSKDESKLDSFEFEVSDGRNSVFRTFRISITDVDNKKPVLFIYRLRLREGTERLITPFELRADDMDTSDRNIQFKVVHKPIHGKLIYGRSREANAFSMADLNDNRVLYVHDGSDTARDNFTFVVSDGTHRDFYVHPNVQEATREPQMFPVEVVPVDNSAPQITVNKGAFALSPLDSSRRLGYRLSGDVLRATDADSVDARLKFVVTVFPSHGIIVNRAVGNRSVVEFTQADLDNADVFYMLHQKANVTRDSFVFKVVDE